MKFLVLSLVLSLVSTMAHAEFVEVAKGRELWVDYSAPKANMPTVILLNGLTYSTRQWEAFTRPIVAKGFGVLRYDMYGMGQTLLKYAPAAEVIPYTDQVKDLKKLLTVMKIKGPYNLVGLSYGGGIAAGFAIAYPKDINNLIMMAPFTKPLDGQDTWIKQQISTTRLMFPYNPASDDELYDYFLHQIVYETYPSVEPIVLENPFKLEGVFRLVQGIRKFRPIDYTSTIPAKKLHLMIARQDQYIQPSVLEEYWNAVPVASRASLMYINGSEHKMVEAVPLFTSMWVMSIVTGNKQLFEGKTFEGFPWLGEIRVDGKVVKIGKEE